MDDRIAGARHVLERAGWLVLAPEHVTGLRERLARFDDYPGEVAGYLERLLPQHPNPRED
jgi:hypothetical protein